MARSSRRRPAPFAQEALDDTVLQAVEGHHRQPAAGLQHLFGCVQPVGQLVQLTYFATTTADLVTNAVVAGLALLGLVWIAVRRYRRGESLVPATWLAALRRRSTEPPPR